MKRASIILVIVLAWSGTALAQTPTPEPDYSASATSADFCFYNETDVMTWISTMETTEYSIDSLIAGVSGESIEVTIDSNPFSLARGFILLMSDVAWLQSLLAFFMLAFSVIVILMVVKTVKSLWGPIKEFIMPIIKMLPFVG